MTKFEKKMKYTKVSAERRTEPEPNRHVGRGRGRNFEAADAALREKIEHEGRDYLQYRLPENEASLKAETRTLKRLRCECGHRGDKHGRFTRWWFGRASSVRKRLHGECWPCGSGVCNRFRPENGAWISLCSKHQEFEEGCALCETGHWEEVV